MRLFIRRKYGKQAEHFVERWIKGEPATPGTNINPERKQVA
jgi:hypothetical protein